jgi:hypothetical protein
LTTERDAARLLEPLARKSDDLIYHRRGLYVREISWMVRGIYLDRLSSAQWFRATFGAGPVVSSAYSNGGVLYRYFPADAAGSHTRSAHDIRKPADMDMLMHDIENIALPRLRAIRDFGDYRRFATAKTPGEKYDNPEYYDVHLLVGDFEIYIHEKEKSEIFKSLMNSNEKDGHRHPEVRAWFEEELELSRLARANDARGIAAFLRRREKIAIANIGLEKHWVYRPFPFEERFGLV